MVLDFEDFFESPLNGFVITDAEGKILKMNKRMSDWLNCEPQFFYGARFSNILSIGGRIYFETHLWPLLNMQGYFEEIALELNDTGKGRLPIYMNCYDRKDRGGRSLFKIFTLFKASDRRLYEENLKMAKKIAEEKLKLEVEQALLREQFIAVLGHDLRNPLAGIMSASTVLARFMLNEREVRLVNIIEKGGKRMLEMINNIMDFARGRLGDGIKINSIATDLEQVLDQVRDELQVAWPDRTIVRKYNINSYVECDAARIAQMVSNLLANAITHGSSNDPVYLESIASENFWQISVTNRGEPIPEEKLKYIFNPFHREDSNLNNGLGLGLYIASEIAKAHKGDLSVVSEKEQTCFTFKVVRINM
ncbi:sensor histidine kinase [Sphingobacterium zeae]|uniref:sensor histidine kinase n=1 Tax=Sphingobacterium zeae TaxID=1776859 RepID=UPI00361036F6